MGTYSIRAGSSMTHSRSPTTASIRRRLVLHVPGYEPLGPAAQRDRLARTLAYSALVWSLEATVGPGEPSAAGSMLAFHAQLAGRDWVTATEIRILDWSDLVAEDLARPLSVRLLRVTVAILGLIVSGTVGRYRRAHWRYACFAMLPLTMIMLAAAVAILVGIRVGGWGGLVLGLGTFTLLLMVADRKGHLGHLSADWIFALDIAHGRRPSYTAKVARFADEIRAAVAQPDVDELLLVGHSLGMVLLTEAVVIALGRDPALLQRPCRLALVGLGSSLLKIALMPAAGRLRDAIARLAVEPGLIWLDYASRRDIVSFHRANPIDVLGLPGNGPRIGIIHPRDMVGARVWRRMRLSVLRQHRHYVMGNERRYFFDYGLMLCGPGAIGWDPTPDHLLGIGGALIGAPQSVWAA